MAGSLTFLGWVVPPKDHGGRDKHQFAITALRVHRFCSSFIPVAVIHAQKMGRGFCGLRLQDTAHQE